MCPQATDTWRAQKLGEAGRTLLWGLQGSPALPHLDLRLLALDVRRCSPAFKATRFVVIGCSGPRKGLHPVTGPKEAPLTRGP